MEKLKGIGMPPPSSRQEFEHNVFLTIDEVITLPTDDTRYRSNMCLLREPLSNLRQLPNGRIFLSSIDERLRNYSNTINFIRSLPRGFLSK